MAFLPMAVYGLEVPPGDMAISARPDIPSAFRITMAAIDPSAEPEGDEGLPPRATLKIIRQPLLVDDFDDEDEDDFDPDEMEAMLAEEGDDDEDEDGDEDDDDDDDDEEVNGGPSDPAKTKKARRAAAQAQIKKLLEAEGMDVDEDDLIDGLNGVPKSAKARGKLPITDLDEGEDEDDDDEDDDDDEGAEIEEFVICTLDPQKQYQQTLDIAIGEDERVWFKVSGTHSIYLTGNYIEPAGSYDDEDDDDDELDYDLEPDEDEIDDDEELDELDGLDDVHPRVTEVDEDEAPALVDALQGASKSASVNGKKGKNKRPVEDEDAEGLDELIAKANGNTTEEEPKLSKKQQKKLKKNDGSAVDVDAKKEPVSNKSDKKVAFAKNIEQGPTPSKATDNNNNNNNNNNNKSTSLGTKTVQGVTLDDRKVGTGPAAKKGDRVGLRYIGKLKDGKGVDANKKGKPFGFKLGSGEVIKGMEIGVQGMSAGGERRITIPAHLAYGSKATGDIPANSTLIFDIKVIEINKGK